MITSVPFTEKSAHSYFLSADSQLLAGHSHLCSQLERLASHGLSFLHWEYHGSGIYADKSGHIMKHDQAR